jgi:hypothetical protein
MKPPFCIGCASQSASVSGRGKSNTCRLRGTGSSPLVKKVTDPFDSNRNGKGRRYAGRLSGSPEPPCGRDTEGNRQNRIPTFHRKITHGNATTGSEINFAEILDDPACCR